MAQKSKHKINKDLFEVAGKNIGGTTELLASNRDSTMNSGNVAYYHNVKNQNRVFSLGKMFSFKHFHLGVPKHIPSWLLLKETVFRNLKQQYLQKS